ncbi:MAG: hypothetical protein AAGD10_00890 [Myxococcota bacterium]
MLTPPFDAHALRSWLGAEPPAALQDFLLGLQERVGDRAAAFDDALDELTHTRLSDQDDVDVDLPLDVVPVLDGPDFVLGFLDAAPELRALDRPCFILLGGQLRPFAPTMAQGLSRLVRNRLERADEEEPDMEALHWVQTVLPAPDETRFRWPPSLPNGHRHVDTLDGLGVLAPHRAFDPRVLRGDPNLSLDELDQWVTHLLHEGNPGSALVVLRDALYAGRRQPSTWNRLGRALEETFLTLGRASCAYRARRRIARHG